MAKIFLTLNRNWDFILLNQGFNPFECVVIDWMNTEDNYV